MRFTSNRSDRKQNRRQGRREKKKRYLRHVTVDEEPSLRRLWRLKLKMDGYAPKKKQTNNYFVLVRERQPRFFCLQQEKVLNIQNQNIPTKAKIIIFYWHIFNN